MNKVTSSVKWVHKGYSWKILNFPEVCGLNIQNQSQGQEDDLEGSDSKRSQPRHSHVQDFRGNRQDGRVYNSLLDIEDMGIGGIHSPVIHVGDEADGVHCHWMIGLVKGADEDTIDVEIELLMPKPKEAEERESGIDDSSSDSTAEGAHGDDDMEQCFFRYQLTLVGSNGREALKKASNEKLVHLKQGDSWLEVGFIKKSYLREHLSQLFKDGILHLKLDLEIFNGLSHSYADLDLPSSKKDKDKASSSGSDKKGRRLEEWGAELRSGQAELAQGMLGELWESKKGTDAVVSCGEAKFPVHKSILAIASPVFSTAFNINMTEASQACLEITDMSPATLELLLRFIYCNASDAKDPVWEQVESVAELLNAAEKYQISRLKSLCLRKLCEELNLNNAAQVIHLMYLYQGDDDSDKALANHVHRFAIQNIGVLKRMEGFMQKMREVPAAFVSILMQIGESH